LLNFAYAFWVDSSQKEVKSFLKEHIYKEKEKIQVEGKQEKEKNGKMCTEMLG